MTLAAAASDNAARIADALRLADDVELLGGDYITEATIDIGDQQRLTGRGSLVPAGDFDVVRIHGGALLHGALNIVASETPGWGATLDSYGHASAAISVDGDSENGGEATNFRPRERTQAQAHCVGKREGPNCGSAIRFRSMDGQDRIMSVRAELTGEGFDDICYMVCGPDTSNVWVTDNTVTWTNWGAPLRALRMESPAQYSNGIDGNTIMGGFQPRPLAEQTVSPWQTCGHSNLIVIREWDWENLAVPYILQHPASVARNTIIPLLSPIITLTGDGDTLVKSKKKVVLNSDVVGGMSHAFRRNGVDVAYINAADELVLNKGVRVEAGGKIRVFSSANPLLPGGVVKEIPVIVDGVRMLVQARQET